MRIIQIGENNKLDPTEEWNIFSMGTIPILASAGMDLAHPRYIGQVVASSIFQFDRRAAEGTEKLQWISKKRFNVEVETSAEAYTNKGNAFFKLMIRVQKPFREEFAFIFDLVDTDLFQGLASVASSGMAFFTPDELVEGVSVHDSFGVTVDGQEIIIMLGQLARLM